MPAANTHFKLFYFAGNALIAAVNICPQQITVGIIKINPPFQKLDYVYTEHFAFKRYNLSNPLKKCFTFIFICFVPLLHLHKRNVQQFLQSRSSSSSANYQKTLCVNSSSSSWFINPRNLILWSCSSSKPTTLRYFFSF